MSVVNNVQEYLTSASALYLHCFTTLFLFNTGTMAVHAQWQSWPLLLSYFHNTIFEMEDMNALPNTLVYGRY